MIKIKNITMKKSINKVCIKFRIIILRNVKIVKKSKEKKISNAETIILPIAKLTDGG